MAANGNHREQGWDALVSPVIRVVFFCFIFNKLLPAKSLIAVGVEGKAGDTSLQPMLPWVVSRDLTPAQPAFPSFPITPGEMQGSDATCTAARSVPAYLDEQKPSEHLALSQQ